MHGEKTIRSSNRFLPKSTDNRYDVTVVSKMVKRGIIEM